MIIDACSIESGRPIESDLCIVGAGTAGIVLAREFIGEGLRVDLVESGGFSPDSETQSLSHGDNIGFPYYPLDTARARFFGGSSTRWHVPMGAERLGARMRPLDPIDFEKRDWVPFSGWPFDKRHLDAYYRRAQAICRIEPESYAVEDWEDSSRPKLPLPDEDVQTIIYKIGDRVPFTHDYSREISGADNIRTWLHANVLEIETESTGERVTGLRLGTTNGRRFSLTAKVFVLALGGIETPRLLLLSNRVQKNGLGNQNDLIGRFFMEHPHFWSGLFVPHRSDFFRSTALYNEVHSVNGVAIIGKLALTEAALRRKRLLNQNVQLIPAWLPDPGKYGQSRGPGIASFRAVYSALMNGEKLAGMSRHLSTISRDLPSVGAAILRKIRDQVAGAPVVPAFRFANMMEQIPNPESRLTLGTKRDLFGQRRLQLNWKITPQDAASARQTLILIGRKLEEAGLGRFFSELPDDETLPANIEGGYHHMGTTRMHEDPRQGVVDADSRVHGVANLFVAGPSVFPTGGYANPVLTIIALTTRLANHLKERVAFDGITVQSHDQNDVPPTISGEPKRNHSPKQRPSPRWVMVIDLAKCNGCSSCAINCSQFNHLPPEYRWRHVASTEISSADIPRRLFVSMSCMQCDAPPCFDVCPTGATVKRSDGIVDIDPQRCMGCGFCVVACPYLARTIVPNGKERQEVDRSLQDVKGTCTKCDFCLPRVQTGWAAGLQPGVHPEATPVCVNSCPAGAIHFGDGNDQESTVSLLIRKRVTARINEGLGTEPSVYYIVE